MQFNTDLPLLEKDGIKYHFLRKEHAKEAHAIMVDAFLAEPSTSMWI